MNILKTPKSLKKVCGFNIELKKRMEFLGLEAKILKVRKKIEEKKEDPMSNPIFIKLSILCYELKREKEDLIFDQVFRGCLKICDEFLEQKRKNCEKLEFFLDFYLVELIDNCVTEETRVFH